MDAPVQVTHSDDYWRQHFDNRLTQIDKRMDELHQLMHQTAAELRKATTEGFPHDDPRSHRIVHENYIKEAEARDKLKSELLSHALKGILWAGLVFAGAAIWNYFVQQVQK